MYLLSWNLQGLSMPVKRLFYLYSYTPPDDRRGIINCETSYIQSSEMGKWDVNVTKSLFEIRFLEYSLARKSEVRKLYNRIWPMI
jgi:hypothetical protein